MNEPMTLVERLRNPHWKPGGGQFNDAALDVDRTVKDMREAAHEIEALQSEVRTLGRQASWDRERVAANPSVTISPEPLKPQGWTSGWAGPMPLRDLSQPLVPDPRKAVLAELVCTMPIWNSDPFTGTFERYHLGPMEFRVIAAALRDAGYLPPPPPTEAQANATLRGLSEQAADIKRRLER